MEACLREHGVDPARFGDAARFGDLARGFRGDAVDAVASSSSEYDTN